MEKYCSICKAKVSEEDAAILTLGGFGNPRYMCSLCEADFDFATRSHSLDEISGAMDRIGKKMSSSRVDDALVLKTVREIMESASSRAEKIKSGEYDFSLDEAKDGGEDYEIPEELLETEEDKETERRESEKNAKFEKISNYICIAAILAVFGYVVYRLITTFIS